MASEEDTIASPKMLASAIYQRRKKRSPAPKKTPEVKKKATGVVFRSPETSPVSSKRQKTAGKGKGKSKSTKTPSPPVSEEAEQNPNVEDTIVPETQNPPIPTNVETHSTQQSLDLNRTNPNTPLTQEEDSSVFHDAQSQTESLRVRTHADFDMNMPPVQPPQPTPNILNPLSESPTTVLDTSVFDTFIPQNITMPIPVSQHDAVTTTVIPQPPPLVQQILHDDALDRMLEPGNQEIEEEARRAEQARREEEAEMDRREEADRNVEEVVITGVMEEDSGWGDVEHQYENPTVQDLVEKRKKALSKKGRVKTVATKKSAARRTTRSSKVQASTSRPATEETLADEEERVEEEENVDVGLAGRQTEGRRFSSEEAEECYELFKLKNGHLDKGFSPKAIEKSPFILQVIEELGWEELCKVPPKHNIDWVREFYAEVAANKGNEVKVRGKKVSFTAEKINNAYDLTPPADSVYAKLMRRASAADAKRILGVIAKPGADWKDGKEGTRVLETHHLKPQANVWFHLIRHTILPTSHDTSIAFERCLLIYCTMERKPFDIGLLVNKSIKACAAKPKGGLWHPALIHTLMEKAHVPKFDDDELVNKKTAMDIIAIDRIMRNQVKRKGDEAGLTKKATGDHAAASAAALDPSSSSLDATAFALLVKMMEENQKKVMEKLDDQESFWEEKMNTQRDDIVAEFEEREIAMGRRIKRQERELAELRKDLALHRQWEKRKEDVVMAEWEAEHLEAATNIPPYPQELSTRDEELLKKAAAAPTPPE